MTCTRMLRTLVWLVTLGVAASGRAQVAEPDPSCPADPSAWNCAPCPATWYARGEGIFYTRDNADRTAISALIDWEGTPTVLMTTDDLDFDYQPGARITVGRSCGPNAMEVSYFGLDEFDAFAQVAAADPGTLHSAFAGFDPFASVAAFDYADLHEISYRSDLHNAEINFRRQFATGPCLTASWLAGVRYMKVRERFLFESTTYDWGPDGGTATGRYGILTHNDLIGAQLGGDFLWHCTERFAIGATAKGAMLGNGALQRNYNEFSLPPPGGNGRSDYRARETALASIVETGLFGQYQVSPRFRLRAGYEVLMVSGLALAPNQLAFNGDPDAPSSISTDGNTVYHGPSCGLEVEW